jgi:hypothetical protein
MFSKELFRVYEGQINIEHTVWDDRSVYPRHISTYDIESSEPSVKQEEGKQIIQIECADRKV